MVHGGSYAGKVSASNDVNLNLVNTVNNLTAGATYTFSGWVNIPLTSDSFKFQIKIEWRNGSTLIYRDTVVKYLGPTSNWEQATASLVAPAGTTNARVLLAIESLNATIYVDDFAFEP